MSDAPKPPEPAYRPEIGGDTSQVPAAAAIEPEPEPGPPGGSTEPQPGASPAGQSPRGGRRTAAVILAVVLGALGLLCVGGLGVGFFLYRQVSEPDRSTPTVVVRQYLDVVLNERDDQRARLFTCRSDAGLESVRQLRNDIQAKEAQYHVTVRTSPEDFNAQQSGASARVSARLRLSVSANGTFQEQLQTWSFSLRKESGWRVCGARQTS